MLYNLAAPLLYHRVMTVDLCHLFEGAQAKSLIDGILSKRELCANIRYIDLEFITGSRRTSPHVSQAVRDEMAEKHGKDKVDYLLRDDRNRTSMGDTTLLSAAEFPPAQIRPRSARYPSHPGHTSQPLPIPRTSILTGLKAISVGSTGRQGFRPSVEPYLILDNIVPEHFCFTFHAHQADREDPQGSDNSSLDEAGDEGYQYGYTPVSTVYSEQHVVNRDWRTGPASPSTKVLTIHLDNTLREEEIDAAMIPCLAEGKTRIMITLKDDTWEVPSQSVLFDSWTQILNYNNQCDVDYYIEIPCSFFENEAKRQRTQDDLERALMQLGTRRREEGDCTGEHAVTCKLVEELPACDGCRRT